VDVWFADAELPRTHLRVNGAYLVRAAHPFRIHIRFDEEGDEDEESLVRSLWAWYKKSEKKGLPVRTQRCAAFSRALGLSEAPLEFLSDYHGDEGYYESLNYECARFVVEAAQWALKDPEKGYTLVDPLTHAQPATWPEWTPDTYLWVQLPAWDGTTTRMCFAGPPLATGEPYAMLSVDARPGDFLRRPAGALAKRSAIVALSFDMETSASLPIAQHTKDEELPKLAKPKAKPKPKNKEHKVAPPPAGAVVRDTRQPLLGTVKRKAGAPDDEPSSKRSKQTYLVIPSAATLDAQEDEMVEQLRVAFRAALGASDLGWGAPPRPPHLMQAPPLKPLATERLEVRPAGPPAPERVAELTERLRAQLPDNDAPLRVNVRRIPTLKHVLELKYEVWPGLWPLS
jgi:hypothetical protein